MTVVFFVLALKFLTNIMQHTGAEHRNIYRKKKEFLNAGAEHRNTSRA
jgi:hypothetical protein